MGGTAGRAPVAMTARRNRSSGRRPQGVAPGEAALAEEHVDAQVAIARRAVDAAEAGAEPAHARHRRAEVSRSAHGRPAEAAARFCRAPATSGRR